MNNTDNISFKCEVLKVIRKDRGLTLEQLGKLIGSSKSHVWAMENKSINISGEKLMALSMVLNTHPCVFYGLSPRDESVMAKLGNKVFSLVLEVQNEQ